jgi:phage baseplate assembly protein W
VADVPHFAFPFQRSGSRGTVNVVEQDAEEHVMACENMIVRCPVGFRADRPEFGWPFPEFRTVPIAVDELEDALRTFEPRGSGDATAWVDEADLASQHISVDVRTTNG